MYTVKSTNGFLNNRKFDSFGEAKKFADAHGAKYPMDVWSLEDGKTKRHCYSGKGPFQTTNIGTYVK